jgi:hypothetical protein
VRDEAGNPVPEIVLGLLSSLGGLQVCAGLPVSDGPSDGLGRVTFSGAVFGGGFTDPSNDERTWIGAVDGSLAEVRYGPARMLASNNLGEIYEVDLATGAASSLYPPLTAGATEIEHDPLTGRTWVQQPGANFNGLFVDPFIGAALTPLLPTPGWAFNGLEYIDGRLYGTGISNSCGLSSLLALDPENGVFDLIGATGTGPLTGLAWNPICRKLYAVSGCRLQFGTSVLSEIDSATGVAAPLFDTGVVLGSVEFGPDGVLYGGEAGTNPTNLYRIDPTGGTISLVGPTGIPGASEGGGVSGLTLVSDPGLNILFNSPDLNGDLVVNIGDVGDLSILFNSPGYSYLIDYVYDGLNNIADVGTFALALGVTCPILPKQVTTNTPEGEIAIAFDESGTQTAIGLSPGELASARLIMRGPAAEMGLRAWEAAIETTPNVVIEDWSLIEGSLDVGRAGDFHVGLAAPLEAAKGEALELATLRFRVLDDGPAHFFVRPVERSSVGGAGPAASVGHARGRLSLLAPSSGSSDVPVAYVNDEAREEQDTPAVVAVDLRNAPNPFNPSTEIRFNLPHAGDVELRIYDLAGRLVREVRSGELSAGAHAVHWNGTDARGASVVSGTYMYQLLLDGQKIGEIGKMVLLK